MYTYVQHVCHLMDCGTKKRLRGADETQTRYHADFARSKIDNTYLVEHIDDTRMTLTYLPLNLPQTLAIGAAQ